MSLVSTGLSGYLSKQKKTLQRRVVRCLCASATIGKTAAISSKLGHASLVFLRHSCWDTTSELTNIRMIHIRVSSPGQDAEHWHAAGPLEFGRGPQREVPRYHLNDPYVSWDQLLVVELNDRQLRVENLSIHVPIAVGGQEPISVLASRTVPLPVELSCGKTTLQILIGQGPPGGPEATLHLTGLD